MSVHAAVSNPSLPSKLNPALDPGDDRIFVRAPEDLSTLMRMNLPHVGEVGIQIDVPLVHRLIETSTGVTNPVQLAREVMDWALCLAVTVRTEACYADLRMESGVACDLTMQNVHLEAPIFFSAQLVPATDELPPQLLLRHREPDAQERSGQ